MRLVRTRASSSAPSASGRRRFDLTADFSAGVQSVRDVYIDQAGVQRGQENALRTAIREEGGVVDGGLRQADGLIKRASGRELKTAYRHSDDAVRPGIHAAEQIYGGSSSWKVLKRIQTLQGCCRTKPV
jgi:hypothetical protein